MEKLVNACMSRFRDLSALTSGQIKKNIVSISISLMHLIEISKPGIHLRLENLIFQHGLRISINRDWILQAWRVQPQTVGLDKCHKLIIVVFTIIVTLIVTKTSAFYAYTSQLVRAGLHERLAC